MDFDDVLLVPELSNINSRDSVDIKFVHKNFTLELPVIASPMKNIVDANFAIKFGELGGMAILHRFQQYVDRFEEIDKVSESGVNFGVAIGITEDDLDILEYALEKNAKIICIDVANGYINKLTDFIREKITPVIKFYNASVMTGNVATFKGYNNLVKNNVNFVRVGIGSGGLCTTRNKTGVGVPQLSAIKDCFKNKTRGTTSFLVADGGIKNSGDAVKAFAFGADLVMVGSLFATTFESSHNGEIYGMASRELQEQFYGELKSVEGLMKSVSKTISLENFVKDFSYSLKSACTYLNTSHLKDLKFNNLKYVSAGNGSIKVL